LILAPLFAQTRRYIWVLQFALIFAVWGDVDPEMPMRPAAALLVAFVLFVAVETYRQRAYMMSERATA